MNKTLNNLMVACLLAVMVPISYSANNKGFNYEIRWESPLVAPDPDGSPGKYLCFANAQYREMPVSPLPFWTTQIALHTLIPQSVNVSVADAVYAPLAKNEDAVFSTYKEDQLRSIGSAVVVRASCAEIKKNYFAQVDLLPFRKTAAGYEKLISFRLILETSPVLMTRQSPQSLWAANSVLASGDWYKIGLTADGVYILDYDQLTALGMDLGTLNPNELRIYGNGGGQLPFSNSGLRTDDLVENAIYVSDGGTPNVFDPSDYVLFYGMSQHRWYLDTAACGKFKHHVHDYSDTTYYFITSGSGPGKRITLRPSDANPENQTVSTFDDHRFHESDQYNLIKSGREWYGELMDITNSYSFAFSFPNIDLTAPVNYTAELIGRSHQVSGSFTVTSGPSSFSLLTNGTDMNYYAAIFAYVAKGCSSYIPTSSNILVSVTKNTPGPAIGWVNYIEVTARRALTMFGDQMTFRDKNSIGPGNISRFVLANANTGTLVWDVTDPMNVVQQGGQLIVSQFEFKVVTDTLREFIAFSGLNYLKPVNIGYVPNQNLHGLAQVDYIIVAHPLFLADANKLGALHAQRDNLSYAVVTPMQIYNEFSSGAQDVSAIRDFVRMFYERSTGPSDAPKYLLLYGDGSYDNKYRLAGNTNFIPTYQSLNSTDPIRSYVSDDFYVQLGPLEGDWDPGDPDKPDLGVGRIPVKSLGESDGVYSKVEQYVSVPGTVNTSNSTSCSSSQCVSFGDWRNMITFVGDDEDGNTHVSQSENIAGFVDTAYNSYNIERIYLDAFVQVATPGGSRYPDAVDAINKRMDRGCLIFNYIGHGGEVGLAHERIIEVNQINNWSNKCNLPLFFTATCEFSRWDDPARTSAGEYVLLNADGGGIGLFTTVRLVFSGPNYSLNRNFFNYALDTMTGGIYPRLGDLNMLTKSTLVPDDNHRNFTLLCDPALTLAYPEHRVVATTINLSPVVPSAPDTLRALSRVTVTGEVRDVFGNKITGFNGILFPTVFDKRALITCLGNDGGSLPVFSFYAQKNVLYKGKASVTGGDFTFSFIVPKDIAYQYGTGRISFYAHNGYEDAHGFNEDIIIGGSDTTAPPDLTGPEIKLYMNDASFVSGGITDEDPDIYVQVFDTNGINTVGTGIGHDLVGILDGNSADPLVLNEYYEANLNSYSRGSIRYPLENLPSGTHTLSVKVWDVYNNSATDYTEFTVAESAVLALDHVMNYPNPFTTHTAFFFEHNKPCGNLDVQIQIFTVSGKLLKTIITEMACDGYRNAGIEWDGLDDFGDAIGKGVYFYRLKVRTTEGEVADEYNKLVILK
ncbi:MAG: type IX secretion system sortase PorU [Bacteroidia bacterium]|nr:type IX secretion system sortase PorU [Bacteroidia bacterium]